MMALLAAAIWTIACGDADTVPGDHPGGGEPAGGAAGVGGASSGGGGWGGAAGAPTNRPARYPADALRSPITRVVVETLRGVVAADDTTDPRVFMKVGASGTVSPNLLYGFAGDSTTHYVVDLDGRDVLGATIDHFRLGDAAGTTPFDRPTLAAEAGRTASWVISGEPSPLDQEIAAIAPQFAFVNYGTNDMNMGVTYRSALFPFYDHMTELLDQLMGEGIVPMVTGLNPRADAGAALWVPTYDAVTRGMCELRQIPYINLYRASVALPDLGLLPDGVHGNVFRDTSGQTQPCVLTTEALDFNYNVRNLLSLQTLDAVRRSVVESEPAPDPETAWYTGQGTLADPVVVDTLPFTHAADTAQSPSSSLDGYPSCDGGQDESGPEWAYRLELTEATPLRIAVLDTGDTDVDLHLLGSTLDAASCVERDDRIIERTLAAGTHHLVVDTYVSSGVAQAGAYLLVVIPCEPGDPDCS